MTLESVVTIFAAPEGLLSLLHRSPLLVKQESSA
jgi:hypothetical protein